ncbi:MAG TPA: sigma-70 family RNA polymerase sigma factor, partial [Opitutales bacterium]|nr:sigma-70 family RNA polymerase sigma factor [Opitutales bacterium]
MTPDQELLQRYAKDGDETAFAEVVRRQVNMVYAVALRVTHGNAALAEDATQSVFTDLARKAGPLSRHHALAGWLHTSARFAALKTVRGEQRRQNHECEAARMHAIDNSPATDWDSLRPMLDDAVGRLREDERAVVVLRFFQGLSHAEVGDALGINENTARKRADRALENLRAHFARLDIPISAAVLASTLTANGAQLAPAGLAGKITKSSLAGAAAG